MIKHLRMVAMEEPLKEGESLCIEMGDLPGGLMLFDVFRIEQPTVKEQTIAVFSMLESFVKLCNSDTYADMALVVVRVEDQIGLACLPMGDKDAPVKIHQRTVADLAIVDQT